MVKEDELDDEGPIEVVENNPHRIGYSVVRDGSERARLKAAAAQVYGFEGEEFVDAYLAIRDIVNQWNDSQGQPAGADLRGVPTERANNLFFDISAAVSSLGGTLLNARDAGYDVSDFDLDSKDDGSFVFSLSLEGFADKMKDGNHGRSYGEFETKIKIMVVVDPRSEQ